MVGSYSNLTQYTYFTSTDLTEWFPFNNGVQIYGMYASETITVAESGSNVLLSISDTMSSNLSQVLGLQSSQRSLLRLSSTMR